MDLYKKAILVPYNEKNEILVQDRANMKNSDLLPWGYFGGEIESNETPLEAVIRETYEELNVNLTKDNLVYVGRIDDSPVKGVRVERDVFLWKMHTPIKNLTLQEGAGMAFKTIDELEKIMMYKDKSAPKIFKQYLSGTYNIKIANHKNELLDVLIEGNQQSNKTVLLAHGMGSDKNEKNNYLRDIANYLAKDYRTVRFDFSSYGKSEGKQREADILKFSGDLNSMTKFVQENFKGDSFLIAHSLAAHVATKLLPKGYKKIIFTGTPHSQTKDSVAYVIETMKSRKDSIYNKNGISYVKRSSGPVQEVGPTFWKELENHNHMENLKVLMGLSEVTAIHPLKDQVVKDEQVEDYKMLEGLKFIEIDGNHTCDEEQDRQVLMTLIKEILDN